MTTRPSPAHSEGAGKEACVGTNGMKAVAPLGRRQGSKKGRVFMDLIGEIREVTGQIGM
jgi:hypothetical protein